MKRCTGELQTLKKWWIMEKKNRNTILSPKVGKATQDYISLFKPNYWQVEGQDRGKYSDRGVQNVM